MGGKKWEVQQLKYNNQRHGAPQFLTHCLLLRGSLLLRSSLFLWGRLLRGVLGSLLLEVRTEPVGALGLIEVSGNYHGLKRLEECGIEPFLARGHVGLHVLLDGDRGGAGAVLELGDGSDDSSFVRHVG